MFDALVHFSLRLLMVVLCIMGLTFGSTGDTLVMFSCTILVGILYVADRMLE